MDDIFGLIVVALLIGGIGWIIGIVGFFKANRALVDMAGLVGLWRVSSFLGLGVTLIGLGAVHRRFVARALVDAAV